jgi:hypothetical protein
MQHRIDEVKKCAEQHSRISLDGDTNLRRDIPAKVVFSDIREEDIEGVVPDPLTVEDNLTVKKLRSMFSRVMGRKRVGLDHVGSVIDVQAAITRRVTGLPTPIFQQEIRGQGFRALLLIDRSSSMRGTKHQQSEKAVRIAARALRYPFVHFDVWGFQSLGPGRVDISRFDPTLDVFTTSKSEIGGVTPLHLAIRCATRYLADSGPGSKHMFVITDGMPAFTTAEGQKTTPRDALIHARDEVRDARKRGLSVTGAVIGEILDSALIYALGPRELGFMFGPKKYWAQINPESIGSGMVDLVSTSFVEYLQGK